MSGLKREPLTFAVRAEHGDVLVNGELTFDSASSALRSAARLFRNGHETLRFNLSGIGRVDSAGVALLVEWRRMAHESGTHLAFLEVPVSLEAMIRVSGVEDILPIGDDPAQSGKGKD